MAGGHAAGQIVSEGVCGAKPKAPTTEDIKRREAELEAVKQEWDHHSAEQLLRAIKSRSIFTYMKTHIALDQITLASYGYHLVISEVKVLAYCFANRRIDLFIMLLQSHIIE